jgi:methanol--5-hydroxybenzimidazolylcobamide Co-methyltransferase
VTNRSEALAIGSMGEFVFGRAPHLRACGRGVICGGGTVLPEINFTPPPMEISESTWPDVRWHYEQIIEGGLDKCRARSGLRRDTGGNRR